MKKYFNISDKFFNKIYKTIDKDYIDNCPTDNWFNLFIYILKKYKWPFFFITLLFFSGLIEFFLLNSLSENFTNWFQEKPCPLLLKSLIINITYFVIGYIVIEILVRIGNFLNSIYVPLFEGTIRIVLNNICLQQPYDLFINVGEGEIASKLQEITDGMSDIFEFLSSKLFPSILQLIITCFFIFKRDKIYFLIFVFWLSSTSYLCFILSKKSGKKAQLTFSEQSKLSRILVDIFSNIFVIKSFRNEDKECLYFINSQKKETTIYNDFLLSLNKVRIIFSGLYLFFIIFIGNFWLLNTWYNGILTPGDVVFLFSTSGSASWVVWFLFDELPEFFTAVGQCKSSLDVFNRRICLVKEENKKDWTIEGKIEFKNVTYKNILKNISFTIEKGKKVGIIGPSGSGKSTLVSLLLKIIENEEGSIIIDGENIKNISEKTIKESINIVTQDNLIFDRSIEENITLGEEYSEEAIMEAVDKSQIKDVVESREEGLKFPVGNKGRRLSGGQKQRLNIARVLVRNPKIIITDEAGSALDPLTEMEITNNLMELYKSNTIISITHDIPLTTRWDYLLVLDKGSLVEEGSPQDLIDKKGLYYSLLNGGKD
jgi:ABC-type multidrug transport system fused ATPase/permease subunit